jgi:transcriptional regulator with XRE-family HTH domain
MSKAEFKNRIREFKRKKGLRQVDLVKLVGELTEIERGLRTPNVYSAKRIAKGLEVSLDELFPT